MSISKFAVRKPATVLIIFILLTALGIYCTTSLPLDLFPEMDIPYIIVYTSYENAGPEEVERSITRTMESSLSSVTGVKEMTSTSSTGSSMIMLEFEYGTNLDAATNDIRDKIDMVRNYLPDESDTPIIFRMDPSMMPIMGLVVKGSRTPEELSTYVEDIIQPRLESIDGVASATVIGDREKAIRVDIPRDRLDAYDLTVTQVAQMIGAQNITSSGGTITSGDSNYTVSAEGTYESVDDIKGTVVTYKARSNGTSAPEMIPVLLRDVADVYEGYKKVTSESYLNGEPSVMLLVQKQSGKNSVATAEKVRKAVGQILRDLPSDVEIVEAYNTTDDINDTVKQVVQSLVEGIIFAVVVLYIFLRSIKSTFIIALSIPVSVLVTLCLMYFCGLSINMMTLSGLLLGIGMLVDNSIVILENIFSYRERDAKPEVAAVLGSEEMISAITSSTLTTVCIFLPMIMFRKMLGMMGKLFEAFAFTIVFSLLCSLLVAAVLVPVLSSKYLRIEKVSERKMSGPMRAFDTTMAHFFSWLDKSYAKGVGFVLHHKKATLLVIFLLFVASILSIKHIGFIFMPETASTSVTLNLEMPQGTTLDVTREVIQQMESNVLRDLKGVKYSTVSVGGGLFSSDADTNSATLRVSLYEEDEREPGWDNDVSAKEKIRKYFNDFPGAEFTFSSGMSFASSAIDVVVKSDNLDLARATAKEIQTVIRDKAKDFVNETTIDLDDGLPELKINMDRNRMYELGVTTYGAGAELNAAVNGTTASRYDDNGTQIDIDVALDEKDKQTFGSVEQLYVANSMGQRIPFASFARYEETLAPVAIKRESQTRTIRVSVEPKSGISLQVVQDELEKIVRENIVLDEGVLVSYDGAFADMIDAVMKFSVVIIMAILLVFAVMASQFESFKEPFIVLFTMPLSVIGVVMIYMMAGQMMNVVTVIGVLVLVGTIVNNGIVLVDYTNLLRKRGYPLYEACVEAAGNRLRPILMSTLTTVTSLVPMAFFPGETGGMTQPIGLTVLGGLTFGSMMTLFVMPIIYYIFNSGDARRAAKKARKQAAKAQRAAERRERELPELVKRHRIEAVLAKSGSAARSDKEEKPEKPVYADFDEYDDYDDDADSERENAAASDSLFVPIKMPKKAKKDEPREDEAVAGKTADTAAENAGDGKPAKKKAKKAAAVADGAADADESGGAVADAADSGAKAGAKGADDADSDEKPSKKKKKAKKQKKSGAKDADSDGKSSKKKKAKKRKKSAED